MGVSISFNITIPQGGELAGYLDKMARQGKDMTGLMKRFSIIMFSSFAKNFKQQGRPTPWKGLAPSTIAARRKGSSRILEDTGRLRMSVMSRTAPGNIFRMSKDSLVMGSNLIYAQWQQEGTKPYVIRPKRAKALKIPTANGVIFRAFANHPGLPARPFVMIHMQDLDSMERTALNWMTGE